MTTGLLTADRRPWHSHEVYLFDIDGTLLNCFGATHYFAFCKALEFLAGRPLNLDGVTAHGNTDVGILRDALHLASVPEHTWRPRLAEARDMMCAHVKLHHEELEVKILPSVREFIGGLRSRGAVLGVATGNLEAIGRCKLAEVGLASSFDFGAYSDFLENRTDVFRNAALTAAELVGSQASICVVGDTLEDIRAAKANSLAVLAVATGSYSYACLNAENPDYCVQTLRDLTF